jgi:hypothetical protein
MGGAVRMASGNKMPANGWRKRQIMEKKEWQSLTDDEIKEIVGPYEGQIKGYTRALFDKIEAKLREKNGG